MKIPTGFPQFKKENVLIIAASSHEAKLYTASEGELREAGSFAVKTPKFSDKESFYKRGGGHQTYGFGASLEKPKRKIDKEFDAEFRKIIGSLPKMKFNRVFLLSSSFAKKNLLSLLPATWKENLTDIDGNYLNVRPLELIGLVGRAL
jgi:hypothetical protein